MRSLRPLVLLLLLPLALAAAERSLKIDRTRSYVDVDVKATMDSFTARLDAYDLSATVDEKDRIKTAALAFRFADLKTGKAERDTAMIDWLGGGEPTGRFELGLLALTPSGQGQVSGNLTFHGQTALVEFPVTIERAADAYVVTGTATINTHTWGLKTFRKLGVLKVDPEVKIRFKFTGVPEAAK
ncbi:YceI-like domain protein [Lacunisphaera limnophila]|uniref:YceI-like domain protein n=1 Tax=Lacunisphaera limnophila TaxID=1838286 RepID=A0A1D8ATE3_9BACT|nr:YceI family protein [Lacunisphaera limnophila]AOS44116.1 YceI-like domain protein [Lacunisphaera limnophila]